MIYNNNIKNTNTGALFGLNTQGYVLDHNISTHTYISIQTLAVGYHLGGISSRSFPLDSRLIGPLLFSRLTPVSCVSCGGTSF